MRQADEVVVRIDALSHGRAAVARLDGKVIFVEGAAPGDLVSVRVRHDHGSYAEADMERLLEAGPARVEPPCPIVNLCGGCGWQHVSYVEQLDAKRRAVVDALTRIGQIVDPPVRAAVPSPRVLGYRNRLRLRFERGRLGFYRARTHALVPIPDCLIAEQRVRDALPHAESFVGTLETRVTRVEISSRGSLPGVVLALNSSGRLRRADGYRVRDFLARADHPVRGVVMWGRGWRREWGDLDRRDAIAENLELETHGASFGQINSEANRLLVATVLSAARPSRSVLDLYAGAGNFSLSLAARSERVDAVEADSRAVAAGRECAARLGIRNVEFHAEQVARFTPRVSHAVDLVVANPPREGLTNAAEAIAALRAPQLVYVSCNPATLARDLKTIARHGYVLHDVTPLDLFPHTFHVESVCDARLT